MLKRQLSRKKKRRASNAGEAPNLTWGFPGHLDSKQESAYEAVRQKITPDQLRVIKFEVETEESALCRFLRARKFDIGATTAMIEECVKIKQEHNAQEALQIGPEELLGAPEDIFNTFNPFWYVGHDKHGNVLSVQKCGLLNTAAMATVCDPANALRYHWYSMESLNAQFEQCISETGQCRIGVTCIIDMEGFKARKFTSQARHYLKTVSHLDSFCYPELMARIFIVNAPKVFSAAWQAVRPFLDPRTVAKISIYSSAAAARSAMLEYVDEEALPAEFGGRAVAAGAAGGALLAPWSDARAAPLAAARAGLPLAAAAAGRRAVVYAPAADLRVSVRAAGGGGGGGGGGAPLAMPARATQPGYWVYESGALAPGRYEVVVAGGGAGGPKLVVVATRPLPPPRPKAAAAAGAGADAAPSSVADCQGVRPSAAEETKEERGDEELGPRRAVAVEEEEEIKIRPWWARCRIV